MEEPILPAGQKLSWNHQPNALPNPIETPFPFPCPICTSRPKWFVRIFFVCVSLLLYSKLYSFLWKRQNDSFHFILNLVRIEFQIFSLRFAFILSLDWVCVCVSGCNCLDWYEFSWGSREGERGTCFHSFQSFKLSIWKCKRCSQVLDPQSAEEQEGEGNSRICFIVAGNLFLGLVRWSSSSLKLAL